MRLRPFSSLVAALLAVLALSGTVRADILFSNLGPGDSYKASSISITATQGVAEKFTVGSDYRFESAELALDRFGGDSTAKITLLSDAGGIPGSILATILVTVPSSGLAGSIVTATSTLQSTLHAGSTYWIAAQPQGGFNGSWFQALPVVTGRMAFEHGSGWVAGPANGNTAMRVRGRAVPEPGSLALIGLGAASVAVYGLRRRRSMAV